MLASPGSFLSHSFIICTAPPTRQPLALKADACGVRGLREAAEHPAWLLVTSGCHPGMSHTAPSVPKSWGTPPLLQLPRSFRGAGGVEETAPSQGHAGET